MPTEDDSKKALQDYMAEVEQRRKAGKLRPGEQFTDENGQVSAISAMEVNARLARIIFESNPDRQFFIEESFPIEWMYPRLAPHGLILKLHREPLKELPAETVRKDRDYWMRFTDSALGAWLKPETPVDVVCDFAIQVFGRKELAAFKGDPKFVRNEYACKMFSKLRSSQGGVYAWRINHSASSEDKQRMSKEAEFALRQAFALDPNNTEIAFRYVDLLLQERRKKEALLVARTAGKLDPANEQLGGMIRALEKMK
jgi:tetratricopeptide repeat protein